MFNRYSLFKPPKILTLILTMLIIFPTFPKNVAAATNVSVTYNFANSNPGFAEGSIKITAAQSMYGNYYIYWADSSAALSGYYEIDKINVTSAEQSISISKNVAIPVKASYLIAIKSDTEPTDKSVANATAVYALPDNKKSKNNTTNALYSFECLSDIHIDKQSSSFYTYAEEHFASALECAAQRKVDFVTTCGDEINNYNDMTSKEWQVYQKIIAESSYCNPIYETLGNHEMQSNVAYGHEAFRTATGLSANTEAVGDKSYYEMTASNGDHFIFMSLDNSSSPNNTDEFTTEQLDWLESLLGKYYNDGHKIFVYEHALFSKYGAGDSKTTPYYGGSLSFNYPSTVRFKGIIEKYKNIFLFSGHTHLALQYEYNYDNQNGTSANMIHIPSCACPTHIVNGSLNYTMYKNDSEGYFVDVYNDQIIVNGANMVDNKILPKYSYIIDQSGTNTAQLNSVGSTANSNNLTSANKTTSKVSNADTLSTGVDKTVETGVDFYLWGYINGKDYTGTDYKITNGGSVTIPLTADSYFYVHSSSGTNYMTDGWQGFGLKECRLYKSTSVSQPDKFYIPTGKATITLTIDDQGMKLSYSIGTITFDESVLYPKTQTLIFGDTNNDKLLNIKDATLIMMYLASKITLDDSSLKAADVTGDNKITINDVTAIQKQIAFITQNLPKNDSANICGLMNKIKTTLSEDYRYSSYDAYMALKKQYFAYKDSFVTLFETQNTASAYNNLKTAYDSFCQMKDNNNIVTEYFVDNNSWGSIKAYLCDSNGKYINAYGGTKMTPISTLESGQNVYCITFNSNKWNNLVINSGDKKTVNIAVSKDNHTGYYITTLDSTAYNVKMFNYLFDPLPVIAG